jgi:hypothetical protein
MRAKPEVIFLALVIVIPFTNAIYEENYAFAELGGLLEPKLRG